MRLPHSPSKSVDLGLGKGPGPGGLSRATKSTVLDGERGQNGTSPKSALDVYNVHVEMNLEVQIFTKNANFW